MNNASNNDEIYKIFTEGNPLSNEDPIVNLPVAVSIKNTNLIDAINIGIMSGNNFERIFIDEHLENDTIITVYQNATVNANNNEPHIIYHKALCKLYIIIFVTGTTVIITILIYFFYKTD